MDLENSDAQVSAFFQTFAQASADLDVGLLARTVGADLPPNSGVRPGRPAGIQVKANEGNREL